MANKKTRELRELKPDELIKQKEDIMKRMLDIRFKAGIEKPTNPCEKRELRKTIAKINTLLHDFEKKAEVKNG